MEWAMGRTSLIRGIAVVVVAMLAVAWAVGVADLGSSSPPSDGPSGPPSPEPSTRIDDGTPVVQERPTPRPTEKPPPPRRQTADPSPDTVEPVGVLPTTPAPPTPSPSTEAPGSFESPSQHSPSPHEPSDPPGQPSDDCTELLAVVDCVLDPITGHP